MMAVPITESFEVRDVDIERGVVVLADGEELIVTEWFDEEGDETPAGLATQAIAEGDGCTWWVDLMRTVPLQ